MRSYAVSCVFAYDFILREKRSEAGENPKKTEKIKRSTDTVSINNPLGRGMKRHTTMTRFEYEEKYRNEFERMAEVYNMELDKVKEEAADEPVAENVDFSTEEFIQEVLSSRIEEEGRNEVIFADLPDYEGYLYPVVDGVIQNIDEIDAAIVRNLKNWSIGTINREDLAILRVAVFEMLKFDKVVPLQIAINEAVELAKARDLKSGGFVNGVLAGVAKEILPEED